MKNDDDPGMRLAGYLVLIVFSAIIYIPLFSAIYEDFFK